VVILTCWNGTNYYFAGRFSSTTNVVIQAGHTVTTSVSQEIKTKDLTINSGGVLKELVTSSSTPYYLAIYGNLTVDGQLGALTGADSIGLDIDGATSTISGSGDYKPAAH